MAIYFPPNDYQEVQTCREDIVQTIGNLFLSGRSFHPHGDRLDAKPFSNYLNINNKGDAVGFTQHCFEGNVQFYKCEVELAIKLLLEAGYYLYRYYEYNSWVHYCVSKNPRLVDKQKVTEILPSDWSGDFK